jgi:DNA-binding XRE family transcriptional regulator
VGCYSLYAVKMPRRNTLSADVHIGRRVRLARQAAKMSSQALAKKLGVTFQQVQKYEKGKNRIAAAMLWEIAGILGHDIAWFIEDMGPAPGGQGGRLSDDCMKLALQVDRLPNDERALVISVIQACLDAFDATETAKPSSLGAAALVG